MGERSSGGYASHVPTAASVGVQLSGRRCVGLVSMARAVGQTIGSVQEDGAVKAEQQRGDFHGRRGGSEVGCPGWCGVGVPQKPGSACWAGVDDVFSWES